jgi:O-antigen ligase
MLNKTKQIFNDTDNLLSYLVIGLAFAISTSVAVTNIILVLLMLVFLYEREYKKRFATIKNNPLVYLILVFVSIHALGVLWSENLVIAAEMLARVKKLLYLPVLMMLIKREHILYYFQAFILGMMLSETITYLVWFDIILKFMYASSEMPSALMIHFNYTVYIAMAVFLLTYFLVYKKEKTNFQMLLAVVFLSTMLLNLLISGGRAGQIGFFVMFFVLMINYFKEKILKGFLTFGIVSSILFTLAYTYIPLFQDRADKAVYELSHFRPGKQDTSLGIRLGLNKNYFEIVKEHPWIGVGTGDYLDEYTLVNAKSTHPTPITHAHNMYMQVLVQYGIFGLISFLLIFVYQLYVGFKIKDDLQVLRIAFPLFFMAISMVYWYLYAFNTMLLFILFSAILYRKFDKNVKILE